MDYQFAGRDQGQAVRSKGYDHGWMLILHVSNNLAEECNVQVSKYWIAGLMMLTSHLLLKKCKQNWNWGMSESGCERSMTEEESK